MGEYTEAISSKSSHIEVIKSILKEQHLSQEARFVYEHELKEYELDLEALQIADRLKQAITDEQTADCIIVDAECVNNKHDKEVWLNGYNQALSDIRGDAE